MGPTGGLVDDDSYRAWARRNDWLLAGREDIGTAYDDWGGARGLSADGTITDGERDLHPAPPADATWLEIIFHAGGVATVTPGIDHPTYTLKLALPLFADSIMPQRAHGLLNHHVDPYNVLGSHRPLLPSTVCVATTVKRRAALIAN